MVEKLVRGKVFFRDPRIDLRYIGNILKELVYARLRGVRLVNHT